ncbi:MAG: TldD/PmbA family protein [Bryobacterales bacterium]|nr:TldD/PmbA family protein [Bryobacterales bacterium]
MTKPQLSPVHGAPGLEEIAQQVVELARKAGASGAECTVAEGEEFEVTIRLGEVETLKESGSRGVGVRVLFGQNTGSSYTSDLTPEGIEEMVRRAAELAKITTPDPFAGLPDPAELGFLETDLELFWDDVAQLDAASKIAMARAAEKVALGVDPRINNSEGASFGSSMHQHAFANSLGFSGSYRSSSCSLSVVPVARDGERMERDYWFTVARSAGKLEDAEYVGRRAAERVLRRLNARKVETQKAPIVFEPRIARSIVGHIFEAVNGDAIYRHSSFLEGKLGQQVAARGVNVIDDATMAGLFGSSPFDDEGVPSRRTVVIEDGVLCSYLLNSYTARKLKMRTTGNASRGITGNASIGHGNMYLQAGRQSAGDLLKGVERGLYVTEVMGFGVNAVTGDYSRGASGQWIENGELAYPVAEVTIAGNLKDMLMNIDGIGDDLEFRGSMACPTIRVGEMTISGR